MLLFADYESYYDVDYTLKRMTPAEYILDPRFEAHGMAVRIGLLGQDKWIKGSDLPAFFDWLRPNAHNVTMVTYNALFDMCITAWRYDFVPNMMVDVLGMVRAMYGPALRRMSLAKVAEYLELPQGVKGNTIGQVIGMSTAQIIAAGLMTDFIEYAKQDVNLMVGAFCRMKPAFPPREYAVMDLVLRCAVQPQFLYDRPLLERHLDEVVNGKAALLAACGLSYDAEGKCPELMSAAKFAKLLEERGVPVEMKTTLTGRQAPALAKTDLFMSSLLEHEDETVAALAAARLGHKSTLEETRTKRFISIASLPSSPGYTSGMAPIPLRYGAAHTHRLGGDWNLNMQNMPRKSNLRKSLIPPEGCTVITADESQIEARISAWIAREMTLLQEFTDNLDPYGRLGAAIFGLPTLPKAEFNKLYPVERFIGKTGILGLGYGAGVDKFWSMVNMMARTQLPAPIDFPLEMAAKSVNMYRQRYHRMPACWRDLQYGGMAALTGTGPDFVLHPIVIQQGVIWGPNGQCMVYPDLKLDEASGDWTYQIGNLRSKIYGAKLLENITQWLARIVVMDAAVRLSVLGLRYALQAHDELVFIVQNNDVDAAKQIIYREMVRRPAWGPDIPLDAEVHSGPNYGAAK